MRQRLRAGARPAWAPIELGVNVARVRPAPGWLVLEEEFVTEMTVGGISLAIARPYVANTVIGRVLAVGVGTAQKLGVTQGDRVVYREYAGGRWSCLGQKVLITNERDILARVLA